MDIMKKVIIAILCMLLLFLLVWRWRVSAVRFFDVDEFSYLHWTAQVARGEFPYVDFFSYFTPGFMWAFAPIFWVFGVSTQVFIAARIASYGIFLGILAGLGMLFSMTRGWKWALLPVVILAFLPMPYDKFLEVRPDNLATLLALLGVIGEIRAILPSNARASEGERKTHWWWFLSGIFYAGSLFVLTKTLPIVAVGALIAFLASRKKFPFFTLGLLGPWVLFFLSAAVTGHFSQVWYSLTKLPFEVYKSAVNFPMEANLFFYPNASFYGGNGYTITTSLIVNHAMWILAILVGTLRVVTPFREGIKNKGLIELLVGGIFFVSIFGYVKFFPAKHSQYLIPIAVFIAYFAADGLSFFFDWLRRVGRYESLLVVVFGLVYLLIAVTNEVNTPKLARTNETQLSEIRNLIATVPLSARVVDLEGRMVFWPEGYPMCCVTMDNFLDFLSWPIAPLRSYLAQYPAEYIYDGNTQRFGQLSSENIAYIRRFYAPVLGWGDRLWKRK